MTQQHTPAAGSSTDHAAIQALRNQAIMGILIAAMGPEKPMRASFDFWLGFVYALRDLNNGTGTILALKDEERSGYQPPSELQAAFAALAKNAESLTLSEVQQILAAQFMRVACKPVAHGQIDAGQQLEDGAV